VPYCYVAFYDYYWKWKHQREPSECLTHLLLSIMSIWSLLKKLKIDLSYDLMTPLLGIYPKDYELVYNKGNCTPMFIAVLHTIAKLWK
jgi:hypothetical protein